MQIQVILENREIAACRVIKRMGFNHDIAAGVWLSTTASSLWPLGDVARGESGRPPGRRARLAGAFKRGEWRIR
jgi:hypothetical protein